LFGTVFTADKTFFNPGLFDSQSYEQLVEKLKFAIEETEGFGQE
jgi:hypothetical protein